MIQYCFCLADGTEFVFDVDIERAYDPESVGDGHPHWTQLEFHRCTNCPLDAAVHRHCPPAIDLQEIAAKFAHIVSSDTVHVTVKTAQREYRRECSAQDALHALFGLVLASSGCPHLSKLRSMARNHLPFSNYAETLTRSAGIYLLRQYLIAQRGGTPDWEMTGLAKLYEELEVVDRCLAERFRAASSRDANLNAIIALCSLSFLVKLSLSAALQELIPSYFPDLDGDDITATTWTV